jgi:hypothetical protein
MGNSFRAVWFGEGDERTRNRVTASYGADVTFVAQKACDDLYSHIDKLSTEVAADRLKDICRYSQVKVVFFHGPDSEIVNRLRYHGLQLCVVEYCTTIYRPLQEHVNDMTGERTRLVTKTPLCLPGGRRSLWFSDVPMLGSLSRFFNANGFVITRSKELNNMVHNFYRFSVAVEDMVDLLSSRCPKYEVSHVILDNPYTRLTEGLVRNGLTVWVGMKTYPTVKEFVEHIPIDDSPALDNTVRNVTIALAHSYHENVVAKPVKPDMSLVRMGLV